MEPLTTGAIAIGSIIATKALEKTGEKVGEALWDKTGKCDRLLGVNHPTTASIRENLTILQRQLTPRATWKGRLCQFVQALYNLLIRRS
jgi:hypothetical protein